MRRELQWIATLGLCTGMLGLGAMTANAETAPAVAKPRTISISASASVKAEPDFASFRAGVVSAALSAKEALRENSVAMRKVLNALKTVGIAALDIRTMQFNVQARYDNPKTRRPAKVVGYRVTNQVMVTVRDIAVLGDALDKVITAGANRVGNIGFDVMGLETKKNDARAEAMRNAIRRARIYALASGTTLGDVLKITESRRQPRRWQAAAQMRVAARPAPVAPGQLEYRVTVNVVWALK